MNLSTIIGSFSSSSSSSRSSSSSCMSLNLAGYISIQLLQKFDVLLHEDCTRTNNYMNSHLTSFIVNLLTIISSIFIEFFWKTQHVSKKVIIVVSKKRKYME